MNFRRMLLITIIFIICLSLVIAISGCDNDTFDDSYTIPDTVEVVQTPPPPPPINFVPWLDEVDHIFFHEVVAFPDVAFPGRTDPYGLDYITVTVNEFNLILEGLYRNGYILVNMHDIWSEYTSIDGHHRMRQDVLMLPEGRTPLIITFDNLSFHMEPANAFMHRYIIGPDGEVWAEGIDRDGNVFISQNYTVLTILERFIRDNPDFSHNGARAGIAQTGLHGLLGYRTQSNPYDDSDEFRLNRMQEIARVRPVIERLNETGWYWASNTWGHIRLDTANLNQVIYDAERWNYEVGSLVGRTNILVYAHGARLDGGDVLVENVGPAARHYINELGFRMFASVGHSPFSLLREDVPAVMMDRMAIDGLSLRRARDWYIRFFDSAEVFDAHRPYGETFWD